MKTKKKLSLKNKLIFRNYLSGTKKIFQDTIYHFKNSNSYFLSYKKKKKMYEDLHSYYFSLSESINNFNNDPLYYIRYDYELKFLNKLKKGYYSPKIFLDVHGLNQFQTKLELSRLMYFCIEKKINCINIMHGYGKEILKKQIPIWLSRHPNVVAFHQSPKYFGSDAAILVLIDF
ncbi:MAG: endonuclease SmrB [Buchnera aphidicola (Periphyllus acericola)]|uniref:endonuclease SmrB n=1 Tax=Buchnera aphidicola TaxID=9 RepID=UPI0030D5C7D5|nr:endonuclease SmrB [Buchnera aphidicola (Periphyllus acericola)]